MNSGGWVVNTEEDVTYALIDAGIWQEYPNPADTYNIEPYTMAEFTSGVGAKRKVHLERKLEPAMEGHRFYDLVRWGRADSRMNEYFQYQGDLTTDVQTGDSFPDGVFPIPQAQIDLSVVDGEQLLVQNPGY